jgi:energy-coupling factor transporter ATP-binding protein EcfA2
LNNKKSTEDGLRDLRKLMTAEEIASPKQLLSELREAWGIAQEGPLVVVGQLNIKRLTDGRTIYALERLEHAETGVGLVYPGGSGSEPSTAYVYADDAVRLEKSLPSWSIAELQLSPAEHRDRRGNRYACTVRAGTLRHLREIPEKWNIKIHGDAAVRVISDTAFAAIHSQHLEQQVLLEAEVSQLESTRNTHYQVVKEIQEQARTETLRAAERMDRLSQQEQAMNYRWHQLSDLLADKGSRLVAMGLLDESDLHALLPQIKARQQHPSHDFQQLLGSDFSRVAPFVQARLWKAGMLFTQAQLRNFLALLRTNDVIVLAGDSGSGKTSLVRTMAESIGGQCTVIPVKPNWTGPEDLLGYFNPIERSYQPTPFLLALQAAHADPETLHFICLDEMNLARVEHYFADFLSLLETRKGSPIITLYASDDERHSVMENSLFLTIEAEVRARLNLPDTTTLEDMLRNEDANGLLHRLGGFKDAESVLRHHARLRRSLAATSRTPTELRLPPNVRIIGAVNVDETTHYLSTKVLDRVHVLRFRNPVLIDWDAVESEVEVFEADLDLPVYLSAATFGAREDYPLFDRNDPDTAFLAGMARHQLDPLGIEFGLRAIRQSLNYLRQAKSAGIDRDAALNNVILHKVLPKLMLDLGRKANDGRPRRDILLALRAELVDRLQGLDRGTVTESCVDVIDHLIDAADGNNGIANYWLR